MRMTKLVFRTLREDQTEAELSSHQLMLRAGLIRQVASGIFAYLPVGKRVKNRIEAIVRQEMDTAGGQEVTLPVIHPAELWRKSGRWDEMGDDLARFQDRSGRDLCLGMTHEEVVTDLASHFINSYKVLPCMLYQVQTKFRDERRPRGGLIRVREFTMKDGYSFHPDATDLDDFYPSMYEAYFRIFRRCGIDVLAVQSDTGIMGGSMAHEFMALTPDGEDTLLICDRCGYRSNRQIAACKKPSPASSVPLPLEDAHTPDSSTIDALTSYLDTTPELTAKAVFFVATLRHDASGPSEKFVFAVLRGDMALNETKLANLVKAQSLRPATENEIRDVGAEPGYGSPIGVDRSKMILVVDDIIPHAPNLIAGANRADYHFRNVNYGRDYSADIVGDIVAVGEGDACPECGAGMKTARGIEVGNIFKLGTKYSDSMQATFLNDANEAIALHMGCYGIGIDRLIATVIEHHHDQDGIKWPLSVAPYQVSLVRLDGGKKAIIQAADEIYERLLHSGLEVLYDDRDERAGVKFNDADLMGIPIRLTVGGKGLERGVVELKIRRTGATGEIPFDEGFIDGVLEALDAEGEVILKQLDHIPTL